MPAAPPPPDWRDPARYAFLLGLEPSAFAWEWLRRDPAYRRAAAGASRGEWHDGVRWLDADPAASAWALHAFEDPDLRAGIARPVWTAAHPRLVAAASPGHGGDDAFDLLAWEGLATIVAAPGCTEHLLLCDGRASLRLDLAEGSFSSGPVRLDWRLSGFSGLDRQLELLRQLLALHRFGRMKPPARFARGRRMVLLLRARDAALAGASQREIAGELISRETLQRRWRSEVPSLRSRAQRLAAGAADMAAGRWRGLLSA